MKRSIQIAFFSFVAVFLAFSLTKNIFSYRNKIQFRTELRNELEAEETRNKELKSDLQRGSDYYYVERQIRDKLDLLKEDEIALIIPDISPTPSPTPPVVLEPYEEWLDLMVR